jgi:hypothetical protein
MQTTQPANPTYHALPDDEEPLQPDIAPDGTDLTLIRWMLSLSYEERLDVLVGQANMIAQVWSENGIVPAE